MSYLDEGNENADPLQVATMLVCGSMAEKMLRGLPERFNWLQDDHDAVYARTLTDDGPDRPGPRELVELRARSLLFTRWRALEAIAGELTRKGYIVGDTVDQLCRANGARKAGHRSFDPDKHTVRLPGGKEVSMRRWADALAATGFNANRAERLLANPTPSHSSAK